MKFCTAKERVPWMPPCIQGDQPSYAQDSIANLYQLIFNHHQAGSSIWWLHYMLSTATFMTTWITKIILFYFKRNLCFIMQHQVFTYSTMWPLIGSWTALPCTMQCHFEVHMYNEMNWSLYWTCFLNPQFQIAKGEGEVIGCLYLYGLPTVNSFWSKIENTVIEKKVRNWMSLGIAHYGKGGCSDKVLKSTNSDYFLYRSLLLSKLNIWRLYCLF
jgi:hypothetical protein